MVKSATENQAAGGKVIRKRPAGKIPQIRMQPVMLKKKPAGQGVEDLNLVECVKCQAMYLVDRNSLKEAGFLKSCRLCK